MKKTSLFFALLWSFFGGVAHAGQAELLAAYQELEDHMNGTTPLNVSQITTQRNAIKSNSSFAGNNATNIAASLDLLDLYESGAAPIFTDEFSRTDASTVFKSLRLAMVELHQAILDDVYNATNLANHRTLLEGYQFESASKFPGQVFGPADPNVIYSVQINASQPTAYGYAVDYSTEHARRPTGAYLNPGRVATVTVPAKLVGKGYRIRVGAHVHDLKNRPNNLKRFDRVTLTYPINSVATEIVSPLGGGIYIEVPYEEEEGLATIQFQNTVRSPFFSNTVARQTTNAEWDSTERSHPGLWADFETDKFMMTVPTAWIYNYSNPVKLMNDWDLAMDACSDLQGLPRIRPKTVLYLIIDVTLKANAFSPGYPQSNDNFDPTPSSPYNGNQNHDYLNGPQVTNEVDFHEFGHASSINKFTGETESIVNLFAVPVLNRMFNVPLEEAYGKSLNYDTNGRMNRKDSAINWAVHAKFRSGQPMTGDEMKYQHRGYGKYVEIAALFGWDALQAFWGSVADDAEVGITYSKNSDPADSRIIRMSNAANANLLPLIHFWGVHPGDAAAIQEKLDFQGIKPAPAIYDRLKFYQSVIPMNASQFSAHRNRISGLMSVNDQPNYEIWKSSWTSAMGQSSKDRIQDIIDLYFPNGRPVEPLPHYEDFEDGIGGWAQATNDNYEWRHNTGPTATASAGPDGAASGDYYMYAEGHDSTGSNKTTSFQCTFDFSTVQPTVLSFDYHMYGYYIDYLAVDINDGTSWTNGVWIQNGHPQVNSSAPWDSATVDLTSYTGNDEVTVRFRTKNTQWNAADPAIDNIRIDVPLPSSSLVDSFETGLDSSWVKSTGADYFFVINSGGTDTVSAGPSSASDGSNYIYAEGHHGATAFKTAGMERQFDFSNLSDADLSFDYHMYGAYIDFLVVDVTTESDGTGWTQVWGRGGQQHNSSDAPWSNATIDLSTYTGFPRVTIRFRTGQKRYGASDVAIDNFSLSATIALAPPVADDLSVSSLQGNSTGITLTASDANGDTLNYSVVTSPSNGTLSGSAPELTYTPNAGFIGTDTFTYIANDGELDSALATVTILNFNAIAYYDHTAGNTNPSILLEGISSSAALGGDLAGSTIADTIDQLSAAEGNGLGRNIALDNFEHYISYTVSSGGDLTTYTSLILNAYAKDSDRRYQISYTIAGESEVFLTTGPVKPGSLEDIGNSDTYDFTDFTTGSVVEFRVYWQGSAASTGLARVYVDDFMITGDNGISVDVIAGYDFDDGTDAPTTVVTQKDANVTVSDYDTGSGLNTILNSDNGNSLGESVDAEGNIFGTSNLHSFGGARDPFGFTNMGDADDLGLAITNNDYMVFTITPDSGYQLDLSRFTFRTSAKTQEQAAERWALFSSVDGFTSGMDIEIGQTTTEATYVNAVVDLSAAKFQGLTDAVTFRLYIYGGNQAFSSATLFDKVIVHGDVTSMPLSAQEVWRMTYFGTSENTGDAADSANMDFDTLNNLMEFLLDTDPTVFDSPYQSMKTDSSDMLIEYNRRKSTGFSIYSEWSPSLLLGSWNSTGESVTADDGEIETVQVTLPFGPPPDEKFVRIVVE